MYLRFTENQFYMCTCNRYLVGVCWLCRHFQGELYIDIFDNAVKGILRKALNDAFRHICCCFISCTVLLYTRKYSLIQSSDLKLILMSLIVPYSHMLGFLLKESNKCRSQWPLFGSRHTFHSNCISGPSLMEL